MKDLQEFKRMFARELDKLSITADAKARVLARLDTTYTKVLEKQLIRAEPVAKAAAKSPANTRKQPKGDK